MDLNVAVTVVRGNKAGHLPMHHAPICFRSPVSEVVSTPISIRTVRKEYCDPTGGNREQSRGVKPLLSFPAPYSDSNIDVDHVRLR